MVDTFNDVDINGKLKLQCDAPSLSSLHIMAHMQVGTGGGSGYTSAPSIYTVGGGATTVAVATAIINATYKTVTSIIVNNGGSGYTSIPGVYITNPQTAGETASAMAIIGTQGTVEQIILTGGKPGGFGYTSTPNVTISGAGSGAQATAEYDGVYKRVTRIIVTDHGTGYSPATTTVTISSPTNPSDPQEGAILATAYPIVENGQVKAIFLTGELPHGQSFARFQDTTSGSNNRYADMFLLTNPAYGDQSPLVGINESFLVEKDFQAGGLVASQQGAILLNYGFKGKPVLSSPPCIELMSSAVPYPSGGTLPSNPEKGQLFNHNGTKKMWNGSSWVSGNFTGNYDTLFLFKCDEVTPANMYLGTLTTGHLDVKSTHSLFSVGAGDDWNGAGYDVYLIPQNPTNGGLGLGTLNCPFKWVDATTVFTNGINLLSGDTLNVGGSIAVLDDSHGFKCNTGATTYFSMMRSGYHGYVTSHFGNLWLAANSDIHLNPAGNAVYCHKSFFPYGAGTYSQGDYNAYWNEVNAKSFPDRGCPIWIDAEDAKAILKTIKPHPTKKSANRLNGEEVPQFDYSNMHEILKPASGGDGIKLEVLVYSMYHALMELIEKVESGSETLD